MNEILESYYIPLLEQGIIEEKDRQRFVNRIKQGSLTREEDPLSHFCAMAVPYNMFTGQVLLVNHRKANMWMFPGGHLEKGEHPTEGLLREIEEELGLQQLFIELGSPFSIQVLDINNPPQICREHFDIFYEMLVYDLTQVNPTTEEFSAYEWLSLEEALKRITFPYYKKALEKYIKFLQERK